MPKRAIKRAPRGKALPVSANGGGDRPRFEVYVIDSGWKTPASEAVRESLDLFSKYLSRHDIYVLSEDQSEEFLQGHPQLLGKDPIIAVLDREAIKQESKNGIGARLLLGRVQDKNRVQSLLKMLLRIVNTRQLAEDLSGSIRREVHREGVSGAIEVILARAAHVEAESGH
jgi:hypothetical protein